MRAADNVAEEPDWDRLQEATGKRGTTWKFAPAYSQWRNGVSEARVKAMKRGLEVVMPAGGEHLTIIEFSAVIKKVSSSINDRPLALKKSGTVSEGEFLLLTRNSLLLGLPPSLQSWWTRRTTPR